MWLNQEGAQAVRLFSSQFASYLRDGHEMARHCIRLYLYSSPQEKSRAIDNDPYQLPLTSAAVPKAVWSRQKSPPYQGLNLRPCPGSEILPLQFKFTKVFFSVSNLADLGEVSLLTALDVGAAQLLARWPSQCHPFVQRYGTGTSSDPQNEMPKFGNSGTCFGGSRQPTKVNDGEACPLSSHPASTCNGPPREANPVGLRRCHTSV